MKVLLLDLDSTNPAHLGCYGYHRHTSPNIDKIAAEGVRFTNYYTSDAPCFPSRTALMTGRFGIHNGVVNHGGAAADVRHDGEERGFRDKLSFENFPNVFRRKGMKTSLISPFAERHSSYTFYAGFNEMYNTGKGGMESAEEVTPVVLDWLERNGENEDWFLYVNYWDPHTPYRAPESFGNPFKDEPLPAWITDEVLEKQKEKIGPHSVHEINMFNNNTDPEYPRYPGEIKNMDDMRKMIDGYDCGVKYLDDHVGMIFEQLEKQGVMEEVIIIITADHGENMGELGIYGEHGTADQGTCRIPMIIRWPGLKAGHVDNDFHYHLDLPPTIAELIDVEPAERWDGQSYAAALKNGESAGRDYLVVSQCAHVCQRSVRFGDWLYIRSYHDGYHLFPKEMLYNLKEDPFEQHDVASENPDLCREAVYYLNEWHDDMMSTMDHDVDPLWTVMKEGGPLHAKGNLKHYVKRLEATGRGHAIPELKKRHPHEFE
ncbi:sulfatase family protein [Bacillus sp. SD088]|uniref:sulfatase family protein n=1 Tax=Bacillus sp. SD088 TaxID=2782012 RepID=UPI001A96E4FE|nr:sulfatase [Bacillus sp. SD088]MBO0995404.1 sulfatase [Bacillus sp. SD088]